MQRNRSKISAFAGPGRRTRLLIALGVGLAVLLALPGSASAQAQYRTTPRVIEKTGTVVDYVNLPPLEDLAHLFARGAWKGLVEASRALLIDRLGVVTAQDLKANYYVVAFAAKDRNGDPTLVHFLLHDPLTQQFSSRLRGVTTPAAERDTNTPDLDPRIPPPPYGPLYEIFLAYDEQDALVSTYTIERKPDELLAQIPGMAKLVAPDKIASLFSADAALDPKSKRVWATLSSVELAFKHADIKVVAQVGETTAPTANGRVKRIDAAARLAKELNTRQFVGFPCGRVIGDALAQYIAVLLHPTNSPIDSCRNDSAGAGCWDAAGKKLRKRYDSTFASTAVCRAGGLTPTDGVILAQAEEQFLKILAPGSSKGPKAEFTLQNRPFKHVSFGVLNSWIAADSLGSERVKLDGGKYQSNPLSGYLGMALVNWHPWGYDGESPDITWRERARLYAGVAFTPEVGFGAGIGVGIVRGLVFNAGWTTLVVDTLPTGKSIGDEQAKEGDTFRRRWSHMFVVGLSFNLN